MSENTVKILWLYDDLMDLYGDSGNLLILANRLRENQIECEVCRKSLGDELDFEGMDFVYMGPGKAKHLFAACRHFIKYREAFLAAVEAGVPMLFTGNAVMALGKSICLPDGTYLEGMGVFDYISTETGDVATADVVCEELLDGQGRRCYGFVNRTAVGGCGGEAVFKLLHVSGDAMAEAAAGSRQKNLIATWLLGPVLVKNPDLARFFALLITGRDDLSFDDALEEEALERTLAEFSGVLHS